MTRDETKKILMIIDATYPNFRVDNMTETIDSYHFFLADYRYEDITIALKTFVQTSGKGFPPSIDQLIAMVYKPRELDKMSEIEAWDMVSKAVRNSAYHAQEEFDKLPATIQRAVGSASRLYEWGQGDAHSFETVTASNFMRTFKAVQDREELEARIPIEAKNKARLESLQRIALEDKNG